MESDHRYTIPYLAVTLRTPHGLTPLNGNVCLRTSPTPNRHQPDQCSLPVSLYSRLARIATVQMWEFHSYRIVGRLCWGPKKDKLSFPFVWGLFSARMRIINTTTVSSVGEMRFIGPWHLDKQKLNDIQMSSEVCFRRRRHRHGVRKSPSAQF